MKRTLLTITSIFCLGLVSLFAQPDTISVSGTTGTTTWTNDNVYLLQGYVRVDNGETLTIQPGTVILADTGSLENASALIVERDGFIDAQGTAEQPIIFTSLLDDVNDPNDFLNNQQLGLWGGVIICGDAPTNTANNGNEQVEGIPATLPATVGTYGGNEVNDNSGILRYVSIRHTGIALASNNEIQGLTLAGVGRGTTIEYVESYASADDGIEIFGGTVNLKHITIAFAEDDALDYDQGWYGNAQWVFIIQAADFGDRLGEWDGADSPEDGIPYARPTIYNMTMIGSAPAATSKRTITFRANGGGKVYNSILIEQARGIDIQYKSDANVAESSYDRFVAGDLDLTHNIFWNVGSNNPANLFTIDAIAGGWTDSANQVAAAITAIQNYFPANNEITDPGIASLSYTNDGMLDPRFYGTAVTNNVKTPSGTFFTPTAYKGAFSPGPDGLWIKGWTALDAYGYLPADASPDTVLVSGTTGSTTWTNDKTYLLQGYVRVDNGDTLRIQAGTVILADTGSLENASALIVERNGYIEALGTADAPIIFTSLLDNVSDPFDLLDNQAIGLWGGVIICGDAQTNTANNGNEQVEGIPATLPASVGTYGGTTDNDNSGILRYVSIRHTGIALASNNEIQGLTLAGVGDGTTIEYVESYASADDGIEIFGGTVNLKHITIAFAEDDMLDYDQGWRGNAQWVFIIQAAGFGDRLGEWDGADTPEDGTPFGIPTIYNMTMIGSKPAGTSRRTITFRANGGGKVYNSVIMEQGRGIDIQYKSDSVLVESSYDRFVAGDLDMTHNVLWNISDNSAAALFAIDAIAGGWVDSATAVAAAVTAIQTYFPANNDITDPKIEGLSYISDNGLDPRFAAWEVYSDLKTPSGNFFTPTSYKGAFGNGANDLWVKNWTALDHYGYLVTDVNTVTSLDKADLMRSFSVFPNPSSGLFTLQAGELKANQPVDIRVLSITGRLISDSQVQPVAGAFQTSLDLSAQPAGVYVIAIRQGDQYAVQKVVKE